MVDLRLPNITSHSVTGKLEQLQDYVYQLVENLNFALSTIESAEKGQTENLTIRQQGEEITPEQALKTFSSIKSLIIKSSDIIESFSEEISQSLEGRFVAVSDFGTYEENTRQTISMNSANVSQALESTAEIRGNVEILMKTNAFIKSGDLGNGLVGIEIGQTTMKNNAVVFNKSARFTSDGLELFASASPDVPIAVFKGDHLSITRAIITSSMKLGGYYCDLSDGIAFRWVGRSDDT